MALSDGQPGAGAGAVMPMNFVSPHVSDGNRSTAATILDSGFPGRNESGRQFPARTITHAHRAEMSIRK